MRGAGRGVRADRPEDRAGLLVGPVVEDRAEDVGVAGRDALEEAARDELDPVAASAASSRTVSGRSRTIAAQPGLPCERARASSEPLPPPTSTTVSSLAPLQAGEPVDAPLLSVLHRPVEQRALAWMVGEPLPEVAPSNRTVASPSRRARRPPGARRRRRAARTRSTACPAGAARTPRCSRRRPARPRRRRRRSRARAGTGAACRRRADLGRELGDGPRAVGERVGDAELGGDRRARVVASAPRQQLPEDGARSSAGAGDRGGDLVELAVGERAAVEQAAARRGRRRRRAARRVRSGAASVLLDRAGEARQLGERERAAADAGDRLLDRAADERREPLGARRARPRRARRASAAPGSRARALGSR